MKLVDRLNNESGTIVDDALAAVRRAQLPHYEESGVAATRLRLQDLYELLMQCLEEKSVIPVISHAEQVAEARFRAGFGLGEVQTAFNVLEEALWKYIVRELPPDELSEALGSVGTILGAGKDKLARTYVSLATQSQVPSLNMDALFRGA